MLDVWAPGLIPGIDANATLCPEDAILAVYSVGEPPLCGVVMTSLYFEASEEWPSGAWGVRRGSYSFTE